MFQRFHAMREEREGGFTLIELLVVILIIAILAAIAIPVFLRQREKGWISQSESALKNAATAVESWATGNNGDYSDMAGATCDGTAACTAGAGATPTDEGYRGSDGVTLTVTSADASGFLLTAVHDQDISDYEYDSDVGTPIEVAPAP